MNQQFITPPNNSNKKLIFSTIPLTKKEPSFISNLPIITQLHYTYLWQIYIMFLFLDLALIGSLESLKRSILAQIP